MTLFGQIHELLSNHISPGETLRVTTKAHPNLEFEITYLVHAPGEDAPLPKEPSFAHQLFIRSVLGEYQCAVEELQKMWGRLGEDVQRQRNAQIDHIELCHRTLLALGHRFP